MSNGVVFRRIGGRVVPITGHRPGQEPAGPTRVTVQQPLRVLPVAPPIQPKTWGTAAVAGMAAGGALLYSGKLGNDFRKAGSVQGGYARINARHAAAITKAASAAKTAARTAVSAARGAFRQRTILGLTLVGGGAAAAVMGARSFMREHDMFRKEG